MRSAARLVAWLLLLAALSSCATVPDYSPPQVLGRTGDGDQAPAEGPVDGGNPLDLVRDFVFASGSSTDRHGSARRCRAPGVDSWDDSAGTTVLDGDFDTIPAPGAPSPGDTATIRIRGTAIGR